MARRTQPLRVTIGDDYTHRLDVTLDGAPRDVSAYTITGSMVRGATTQAFTVDDSNAATGIVLFNLTDSETADLEGGLWRFTILAVLGALESTWLTGGALVGTSGSGVDLTAVEVVDDATTLVVETAGIPLPGSGGGVTDHGALTGLADDDHTQYLTNARGDARYDALGLAAAEATARGTAVTNEATARANADTAEATARANADSSEATTRGNADTAEALARAAADALLIPLAQRAAPNGVATLDASTLIPDAQIPSGITRDSELSAAISAAIDALLAGAPSALDTLDELAAAINDDASFAASVTTALAAKVSAAVLTTDGDLLTRASGAMARITRAALAADSAWASVYATLTDVALKAPLASPALTGNPTAPTATAGDNDTSVATTAFVTTAVGTETTARVADVDAEETRALAAEALLAPKASPTFTGTPAAPTAAAATNTTQVATTAFVTDAVGTEATARSTADALKANLASPTFTGDPKAPTPSAADNDTSVATTAFVQGEIAAKAPLASPALTGNPTAPTPTAGDNDTSIATTAFVTTAVGAGGSADKLGLTPTAVKTSAYTAAAGEFVLMDTSGGFFAVTLPTTPADGSVVGVKQVAAGASGGQYNAGGSDTIEAAATFTGSLVFTGHTVVLQYKASATRWYVVANHLPYSSLDSRYYSIVAESHADVSVVNSTTETAVVDLTLPAGAVAAGDTVRLTAIGDCLNSSGSTATWTPKIKIGSTTVLTGAAISRATNGNRLKWTLTVDIKIQSTTAQRVGATLLLTAPSTANWDAIATATTAVGYGTAAEDTSTSKAIQFTITPSAANASLDFVVHASTLELVKKR